MAVFVKEMVLGWLIGLFFGVDRRAGLIYGSLALLSAWSRLSEMRGGLPFDGDGVAGD